jgi:hypothetical protein
MGGLKIMTMKKRKAILKCYRVDAEFLPDVVWAVDDVEAVTKARNEIGVIEMG